MIPTLGFTHGFIYRKSTLFVAAVNVEMEEADVYHGYVLRCKNGNWSNWPVENRLNSFGVFDLSGGCTSLAMGPDGRVQVGDDLGFRWENVESGYDGPSRLRPLTCMRRIGDAVYAVGMSRMVYRRSFTGEWVRVDAGVRVPRGSLEITGFLGVDGFNDHEIYAVGFCGAMWHFDRDRWQRIDGPTNLKLECVRCAETGQVFIAGSGGTILRGRNDSWEVVKQDLTRETFWGMEYAFGGLYLATAVGQIYRLVGDEFSLVDTGIENPITTRSLHYNDNLLLSTGSRDLCLFDGERWIKMKHPE